MRKILLQSWQLPPTNFRLFIITILILGVFFRFANIDGRVYWHDETYTSLRIAGFTVTEVIQNIFNGKLIDVEQLQKFQQLSSEKGVIDTIKALMLEDQQHPPVYYVIAHYWAQLLGDSVAAIRSLSAFTSLLAFPCIYWLCLELFQESLTGWVAVALIAVSPFQIHYAQEAREYSLLGVVVLLSSAALLQAIRLHTWFNWVVYAATLILGLYTNPLFGLVAIAHGSYVLINRGLRLEKTLVAYLLASTVAFFVFFPWLVIIITNSGYLRIVSAWMNVRLTWSQYLDSWIYNLTYNFFLPLPIGQLWLVVKIFVLFLIGYALYFLCYCTNKKTWSFIIILIILPTFALVLPDLISGGMRSTIPRYIIPCYLGIEIATAHLLAMQISSINGKYNQQRLWLVVLVVLVSISLLSNANTLRVEILQKPGYDATLDMAQSIERSSRPLVLSSEDADPISNPMVGDVLSLGHLLKPKIKLQLTTEPILPEIPTGFDNIFVFKPIKPFKQALEQKYKLEPAYKTSLWRLKRKA
ncbi:glycosyltransferase family 39 protein [Scytonema sp. NUACC26]|uniref:glycosyltransferase family 39 protein n=1 Tax=Scytonema sp. NUACC26 TaxID=3140176 RepID=UPI0034DC2068